MENIDSVDEFTLSRYVNEKIVKLRVVDQIEGAKQPFELALFAVPTAGLRPALRSARSVMGEAGCVWACKGFEQGTGKLPHEIAAEELAPATPCAVLSGPSFAADVARGLPTAVTLASRIADINTRIMTDPNGRHASKPVRILSLKGSFHGRTDRPARFSDSTRPACCKYLASFRDYDNLLTVEPNNISQLEQVFDYADKHQLFIEAFFMEPVMGEGNPGQAITPTMASMLTAKAFIIVIFGGLGSMTGAIIAGYIVGLKERVGAGLFQGYLPLLGKGYADAYAFILLLILVVVKPEGLFGEK